MSPNTRMYSHPVDCQNGCPHLINLLLERYTDAVKGVVGVGDGVVGVTIGRRGAWDERGS
jgi:hypothetical protein